MTLETISLITNLVLAIVLIIGTFRRKPPIEAQFADLQQNSAEHVTIHKRISELRDEADKKFMTRVECQQSHAAANEMRSQIIGSLGLINEKLDTFIEMRGEVKAKLEAHDRQLTELFRRANAGVTS